MVPHDLLYKCDHLKSSRNHTQCCIVTKETDKMRILQSWVTLQFHCNAPGSQHCNALVADIVMHLVADIVMHLVADTGVDCFSYKQPRLRLWPAITLPLALTMPDENGSLQMTVVGDFYSTLKIVMPTNNFPNNQTLTVITKIYTVYFFQQTEREFSDKNISKLEFSIAPRHR